MHIPGLVMIGQKDDADLEALAATMGISFLEEPSTEEFLRALDVIPVSANRKAEISQASMYHDLSVYADYDAVYTLPDRAGMICAYRASELGDVSVTDLEDKAMERLFADTLTASEKDVLATKMKDMEAITDLSWHAHHADGADYIHFVLIAVDPQKRGSGAFRRILTPFLEYADEHGLTCYLECYSEHLEQLYGHFGFTLVEAKRDPAYVIEEKCMQRIPVLTR